MAEMAPEPLRAIAVSDAERYAQAFPDLYDAATEGRPSFKNVIQAHALARSADPEIAAGGNWLVKPLRDRFGDLHGGIEKDYYCSNVEGGCLLGVDRTLHSILNAAPLPLSTAEITCKVMAREARYGLADERLTPQLEEATDHAYSALTRVMAAADLGMADGATDIARADAVTSALAETAEAKQRVDALLQRQSRFEYFLGVIWSAPVTIALTALLGVVATHWWGDVLKPSELTGATTMAALGAIISVVQRMSSGSLVVDHTASRKQRQMLGALRPVVGAIFGAVAYFAVLSSLIASGSTASDRASAFAFFAFVGFAAGFSERFATDMLERAGHVLGETATPPAP